MHRNRTWTLDPPEWRTQRNRLLPIEGGDGSTLNLDFTTGVLDPRLTFSRTSTATLVNSSGYVQFADTNLVTNSELVGPSQPTNWTVTGSWNGSTPSPGVRRVTTGATAVQNFASCAVNITPGITYSFSIYVSEVSGQHYANTISPTGTAVVSQFYLNGNPVGAYTTALPGLITAVFTTTAGTVNDVRMGIGSTGSAVANAICEFSKPSCVQGNVTQPTYFASPVTTPYHAPRFDYSSTTIGEPKGLLIEGQTPNNLFYSQDVTQATRWTIQGGIPSAYTSVSATSGTAPDNTNTANLCTESSGAFSRSIYQGVTLALGTYTGSVWVKAGNGNPRFIRLVLSSAAGNFVYVTVNIATGAIVQPAAIVGTPTAASATVTPYPNSWYRIQLTGTLTAAVNFMFIVPTDSATATVNTGDYGRYDYTGNSSTSFLLWGAQLEANFGASSYIPTGASTVTRNGDDCKITGTNFSSWFNNIEGTCLFVGDNSFVPSPSNFANSWGLISAANSLRISQYTRHTDGRLGASARYLSNPANALTFDSPLTPPTIITTPTVYRTAFALKTSDFAYSANGNTVGLGEAAGVFETVTSLEFARDGIRNGHIKQFKFFPTRLSNSQLQQITNLNYVAPTLDIDFVSMTTGADLTAKGITFSRLTNATLINTAGVVQYADANEIRNSTMLTASNWTQGTSGGSPSVTINGNNTVTAASVAGIATWVQTLGLTAGLPISFSIEVTALTNTDIRVSDMFGAGFGFTGQTYYYTNTSGVTSAINSLTVVSNIGLYTVTATTTGAGGNNIIFGTGCNSFNKTGSITFARPQLQYGTVVPRTNYFPNTSTAASYQGPRFNNAVLTSRANYIKQSNNFTTAPWAQKDGTHLATVTAAYEAAPPGFTGTATRITSSNAAAGITQALTLPAVSGKQIVISFYAKSNKTGSQPCYVQASAGGIEGIEIPTTWTRVIAVNAAINSTLTEVTLYGFVDTLDFSIYGMQVEYVTTGSPLTAYIPTTTIGAISRTTKPRGILIEQATENLSLYSGVLYAGNWGASGGVTRSQDTLLPDPSGSNNACQITKASGFQYVVVNQAPIPTFTVPANSTRYLTGSVWLRVATSGQVPSIGIFDTGGTAFGTRYQARTDNDLVTISSGSGADIDITFGSVLDWVRVSVTRVFTNSTASPVSYSNLALYIYPNRQNENAATIYAWGTQMELASGATTYLPSVASASVRSLESCYLSGSNFTSWYNIFNPAGTFYTEFDRPEASATSMGNPVPIGFGDYAPGKLIMVSCGESSIGTGMFAGIWTNVNFFSGTIIGAVTRKESNKIAFSFNENRMRSALNTTGLSNVIAGAGSLHTKEVLYIGSDGVITSSIPAGSRDWLNGCVQRVVFYPTEFTPAQLTAIVS